jgi:hypothetical protein
MNYRANNYSNHQSETTTFRATACTLAAAVASVRQSAADRSVAPALRFVGCSLPGTRPCDVVGKSLTQPTSRPMSDS